ncbi:type ISP restriction/modification enzyme [Silanimonas sp.]|jgi:predicted helicase|uniref:type ISP restriction/modification enzyme n=1 Tax=Silanimonas sp. TaxID=1929290 RepID=UPI0037C751A2
MSKLLINQYLGDLSRLKQVSGTSRESVVREAFKDLLKGYARSHDLVFVPEFEIESPAKERRYVDGALLHALRLPFGYWEAKDEKDDLDAEIALKFKRGYPKDNIIFDDSTQVVLIQNGIEVTRCRVEDTDSLQKLLGLFFGYQRPEIAEFRKAVEQFTTDLPAVIEALRAMIESAQKTNAAFSKAAKTFLLHAQKTINPSLTEEDVREILIQHILTDEIFDEVFPGQPFHKDNNVARELHKLEETFFTGNVKFQTLKGLEVYYRAIRSAAARIGSHHEKQTFLKTVYENFYKVYNPKAADRLGVVYTPNEIVRFMIESADWLCETHFRRNLIDRDVEILDPAVGTGTFITELIEHFRGQPAKLKHKYLEELHANEVSILPYYVANLNIEATYAAITGEYEEFPGLCLVDTLDNTAGLGRKTGDQVADLFGMGDENVERIKRQNRRKISVIIGNPPYNANQLNENDNNKNREYPEIDRRIKDSYIKASTAQKTKLYDMYSRFFRWASDRLHDDGVLAFITNRSFLDARTFDGFRKIVAQEFAEIRVVDLGGDVRANPKLSGTTHNVFGIQTGVAISFLVKKRGSRGARIFYARRPEMETAEEKLASLAGTSLKFLTMSEVMPDGAGHWLNLTQNDFETLLPLATKATKSGKRGSNAIFRTFSLGVSTNRDSWVSAHTEGETLDRMAYFIEAFEASREGGGIPTTSIKWSRNLKRRFDQGRQEPFDETRLTKWLYRPFTVRPIYDSDLFIDERGAASRMFPSGQANSAICFTVGGRLDFNAFATSMSASLTVLSLDANQCLPRRIFGGEGDVENITDWALKQFREHYGAKGKQPQPITKDAIFHYVYAALHDPVYREKYAQNLKREFPRIPLYGNTAGDFWRWAGWGEKLMALHLGFETVEPWPLTRTDVPDEKARKAGQAPKPALKADKIGCRIVLDSETTLVGVPAEAWTYVLGNRSALEWVLDQHKESQPKDPTIRARFNTYRFADHKERVVDLLARVTRVSVETQAIVDAMAAEPR